MTRAIYLATEPRRMTPRRNETGALSFLSPICAYACLYRDGGYWVSPLHWGVMEMLHGSKLQFVLWNNPSPYIKAKARYLLMTLLA